MSRPRTYLELPHDQVARGVVLARRIKAVLDRKAWVDVEKLSPLSSGDLDDDLPRFTDEIARFEGPDGVPEPVRLVRRNLDGGRWLFSENTVRHIDERGCVRSRTRRGRVRVGGLDGLGTGWARGPCARGLSPRPRASVRYGTLPPQRTIPRSFTDLARVAPAPAGLRGSWSQRCNNALPPCRSPNSRPSSRSPDAA